MVIGLLCISSAIEPPQYGGYRDGREECRGFVEAAPEDRGEVGAGRGGVELEGGGVLEPAGLVQGRCWESREDLSRRGESPCC